MENKPHKDIFDLILEKKIAFLGTFFIVFIATYTVLAIVDFLPEPVTNTGEKTKEVILNENEVEEDSVESDVETNEESTQIEEDVVATIQNVIPERIIFDALDKTVEVLNPESREVEDLDNALLSGVVRHPDSATLDQNGTVFILGHSSYLPVVNNQNFKAFNGIQDLKWGDLVRLQSGEMEYVYRIDKVFRAYATNASVPIAGDRQKLVLATCNSFGSVDDRYIVEADLLEVRTL